jgi:hypothetical protein
LQRGAQGVIAGLGENVRSGRDQMGADAERRTGFELALDGHPRLVDLSLCAHGFELLLDQGGKRG